MPSGKIKWFNAKKGYGFITEDEKHIWKTFREKKESSNWKYKTNKKTPKTKKQILNYIKMRGSIMPSGKIKWFNSKKGYGFITDDETNKDIFLHVSALEESKLRILKEEQQIKFDIKEEKNKLQAINIKKL